MTEAFSLGAALRGQGRGRKSLVFIGRALLMGDGDRIVLVAHARVDEPDPPSKAVNRSLTCNRRHRTPCLPSPTHRECIGLDVARVAMVKESLIPGKRTTGSASRVPRPSESISTAPITVPDAVWAAPQIIVKACRSSSEKSSPKDAGHSNSSKRRTYPSNSAVKPSAPPRSSAHDRN